MSRYTLQPGVLIDGHPVADPTARPTIDTEDYFIVAGLFAGFGVIYVIVHFIKFVWVTVVRGTRLAGEFTVAYWLLSRFGFLRPRKH
jgi:hypothetical protein